MNRRAKYLSNPQQMQKSVQIRMHRSRASLKCARHGLADAGGARALTFSSCSCVWVRSTIDRWISFNSYCTAHGALGVRRRGVGNGVHGVNWAVVCSVTLPKRDLAIIKHKCTEIFEFDSLKLNQNRKVILFHQPKGNTHLFGSSLVAVCSSTADRHQR